jgi:hypothetical protein
MNLNSKKDLIILIKISFFLFNKLKYLFFPDIIHFFIYAFSTFPHNFLPKELKYLTLSFISFLEVVA